MSLFLEGTKKASLEDRNIEINYYLVEEKRKGSKEGILYGIQIEKKEDASVEVEDSGAISYSKEIVKQMIHTLMESDVTPVSMLEVIDGLVTEQLCS